MARRIRTWLAVLGLTALGACGPLAGNRPLSLGLQAIGAGSEASAMALDPRRSLSRDIIEASPVALMLFAVVERDAAATAQLAGENGGKQTWVALGGIAVTLEDGLVKATRGLGDDLMGADTTGIYHGILRGSGTATRILDFMGSNDEILRRVFECSFSTDGQENLIIFQRAYATRRVVETCSGPLGRFENRYWIDGDGIIWQSRQWVSPDVGHIDYQRL